MFFNKNRLFKLWNKTFWSKRMPKKKSHEENRQSVCSVCFRKGSRKVSPTDEKLIRYFVVENFDASDPHFASALCGGCYLVLHAYMNGYFSRPLKICLEGYAVQIPKKLRHQSESECECRICKISQSFVLPSRRKVKKSSTPPTITLCSKCLSAIGKL